MSNNLSKTIFGLFVISGFCGLLYQIIWLRMAFASFGVITPVLSVVVSVFMFGLSLGSWIGGKWSEKWRKTTKSSPIFLYALSEFMIGVGAILTPILFHLGQSHLISTGGTDSAKYLLLSAIVITGSLVLWCTCMGMTYPSMIEFLGEIDHENKLSFSFLYLANVIGAMLGALTTALVLIELIGLYNCLKMAAVGNGFIAMVSSYLGYKYNRISRPKDEKIIDKPSAIISNLTYNKYFVFSVLFITGFCSLAMEVVWVRAFTPTLSTTIYSFAFILAIYLLATWVGSYLYRKHIGRNRVYSLESLLAASIIVSIFPLVITDPRLGFLITFFGITAGIFLFCILLGYMTPLLIDQYSLGSSIRAGKVYAVNILGCILGPLFAGYVLLPIVGIKLAFVTLSLPFVILFLFSWNTLFKFSKKDVLCAVSGVMVILLSVFYSFSYEEIAINSNSQVRRDYVATVVSSGQGMRKQLYTNGISITHLTPITKMMAHVPLAFHAKRPQNALVICLGMGTTYRSLISWDISAKAVELIPSVKEAFPYYFHDADKILNNPMGEIVIDDGRRYLKRTNDRYDVITIDPPPPIEASGSSLLYSIEFYSLLKSKLKEGGILQQWFPGGEEKILEAVARSLVISFPHIRVFRSVENWGFHFIASMKPIDIPTTDVFINRMPQNARIDFMEWYPDQHIGTIVDKFLSNEQKIGGLLSKDEEIYISDDKPFNEYFLLRRFWKYFQI
jgi:spermidine synthase